MKTLLLTLSALSLLTSPALIAQDQPGKASDGVTEITPKLPAADAFRGRILALDPETKIITVQDEQNAPQSLHVGADTKLLKAGEAATWDDLKVGAKVEGMGRKDGARFHAESLQIGQ